MLDFDLRADNWSTPVKEIVGGQQVFNRSAWRHGGRGLRGEDWLGSPMAMANLYAFGRLAWDPDLTPEQIANEWIREVRLAPIRLW